MCCVLTVIIHKVSFFYVLIYVVSYHIHSKWVPVITWRVLRLRKETAFRGVVAANIFNM